MGGSATRGSVEFSLDQPTPRGRKVRGKRRPLFRGYHLAFATLASVLCAGLLASALIGWYAFRMSPLELLKLGDLSKMLPGWFLLPLLWIGLVTIELVRRRSDRPTRALTRLTRFRADWLLRGAILLAGYFPMARSYGALKSAIPKVNPYYLDPFLAKLDIALLGDDGWRVAWKIAPSWVILPIDRIYLLWFTYVILVTGIIVFSRDVRFQIRGALTFALCWFLLGCLGATALSSVGPWYYDATYGGHHFADLTTSLAIAHREHRLFADFAMKFLANSQGTLRLGAGISAMPSLHVSISFLGILLATQYSGRMWLKAFTVCFTTVIFFGSVYLGWHYLTDGLVSIVLTWLIWIGTGRFVDRTYRKPVGALTR